MGMIDLCASSNSILNNLSVNMFLEAVSFWMLR